MEFGSNNSNFDFNYKISFILLDKRKSRLLEISRSRSLRYCRWDKRAIEIELLVIRFRILKENVIIIITIA